MYMIYLLRVEYKEAIMGGTHRIIQVKGHYEVYDENGNFVSSGDTWDECYYDLMEMIVADARQNIKKENLREAVAS